MFGAIDGALIMELARDMGVMTQMELDIPRHYVLDEEFFSTCIVSYHHLNGKGQKTGTTSSVDHPAFAALRRHLGALEYIKIETNWCNGDRVLKPFYLNDFYLEESDTFFSAGAWGVKFKVRLNNEHETKLQSSDSRTVRVG